MTTQPVVSLAIPSKRVTGVFEAVRNDTLYLSVPGKNGGTQYFAKGNVLSVERTVGRRHPYLKSAVLGTVAGTALGYAVFRINARKTRMVQDCFTVNQQVICNDPVERKGSTNVATPVGAALGLVGGLVIGGKTWQYKWALTPVGSLR